MQFTARAALCFTILLTIPATSPAGEGGPSRAREVVPDTVLLVGNSFLRGIPAHLKRIFRKDHDTKCKIKAHVPALWSLKLHAKSGRTSSLIGARPWDFVVLQEKSTGIGLGQYPHVETLHDRIDANGSSTVLFMTWRDRGDPLEAFDSLHGFPGGPYGYIPIAFEIDVPVAPAGWAVRNAVADGLPIELWRHGRHLNIQGRYLVALVLYSTFTHLTPVGVAAPARFTPSEVAYLQQLAHDTVLIDPGEWNIPVLP